MTRTMSRFLAVGLIGLSASFAAPALASSDEGVNCVPSSAVSSTTAVNRAVSAYDSYGECYYECFPVGDESGNDQYRTCWNNCVARYYRNHGHY